MLSVLLLMLQSAPRRAMADEAQPGRMRAKHPSHRQTVTAMEGRACCCLETCMAKSQSALQHDISPGCKALVTCMAGWAFAPELRAHLLRMWLGHWAHFTPAPHRCPPDGWPTYWSHLCNC